MCRKSAGKPPTGYNDDGQLENDTKQSTSFGSSVLGCLWPLSPHLTICLIPFIPSSLYVNVGYTKWFHLLSFFYLLTQNKFLSKFLALMGTTVTLGWWASLSYDYYQHNRFAHILYWNMPQCIKGSMLRNGQIIYDTPESMWMIVLSHILDTLGHPLLALYFWKLNQYSPRKVLSWQVIISTYLLSRIWSLFHTFYNDGTPSLHYIGYDVYAIHDDNRDHLVGMWMPAYIMEAACYFVVLAFKLILEDEDCGGSINANLKGEKMPLLKRSSTSLSCSSSASLEAEDQ